MGPVSTDEVKLGLSCGEFSAHDKICSSRQPLWTALSDHPRFASSAPSQDSLAQRLFSPPPPQILRAKSPPPPPVPEVIPEPPVQEVVEEPPAPEPLPAAISADPEIPAAKEEEPVAEPAMASAAPVENNSAPDLHPAIPARPEYTPIFIANPTQWSEPKKKLTPRIVKIEFKFPEKPLRFLLLWMAMVGIVMAAVNGSSLWQAANKTRDLKDFRLPDPSSPTLTPSETGDPIPSLQAPTRPQRE